MRVWKREGEINYKDKEFCYSTFCDFEKEDDLSVIYAKGFLPMSESMGYGLRFYEARGCRVRADKFEMSSENRRVASKFDGKTIVREEIPVKDFDFDKGCLRLCSDYLSKVHGLSGEEKLKNVLFTGLVTHVSTYKKDDEIIAYVFLVKDNGMTHFWYSFFGPEFVKKSFGIYLMLQEIMFSKRKNEKYIYLGTCYGTKGRYKLNFTPIEFWDGNEWVNDEDVLKSKIKGD